MENKITEMSVNLNTLGKSKLHLELTDEAHTKITVLSPSKALSLRLISEFEEISKGNGQTDFKPYYTLVAELLSNNVEKKKFTTEELEQIFDEEDLVNVLIVLNQFIVGIANRKN